MEKIASIKASEPNNLMAKHWSDEIYFRLPLDRRSQLLNCVKSGCEYPHSKIGLFAMGVTDYDDFSFYFDKIIGEIHGISGNVQHISSWDLSKVDGLPPHGKMSLTRLNLSDTFIRVSVERNLRCTPLPGAMVSVLLPLHWLAPPRSHASWGTTSCA